MLLPGRLEPRMLAAVDLDQFAQPRAAASRPVDLRRALPAVCTDRHQLSTCAPFPWRAACRGSVAITNNLQTVQFAHRHGDRPGCRRHASLPSKVSQHDMRRFSFAQVRRYSFAVTVNVEAILKMS
jgi:hypothetical protein